MELVLGRGKQDRERGEFPPWQQTNMLLTESEADEKGYNLLSRPPLALFDYIEAVPSPTNEVRGIFYRPGLFGGKLFTICGPNLFVDGVSVGGDLTGSGPVVWAAGFDELVFCMGEDAYSLTYSGATPFLFPITLPDGFDCRSVHWMARRFVYVRKDSGRMYWSEVDDGQDVDGLNFLNAESEQDELYDIKKIGTDAFALMGQNSIETWVLTGDDILPWSRVVQRTYNRGVQDTGCAEEIEGTVYFLASDGMVCRLLEAAERVSRDALDEKLRQSTAGSTYWFQYEGKPIFVMRLDSGTYALDLAMDHQPFRLETTGRDHFAPMCCTMVGSEPLFGDDTGPSIWQFENESTTDAGEVEMPQVFTAGLPMNRDGLPIFNVVVYGNNGAAVLGVDPRLEMRHSRDGGRTWSDWKAARWGLMGEYPRKARFGSCGSFGPPGFLAEFRMIEVAPLRIGGVRANESLAGRGL